MSDKVFVPLTEEELKQRAEKLAGVVVQMDELAEERKEANKDFADRKKALSRHAHELSASIRHKGEWRDAQTPLFKLTSQGDGGGRKRKDDA
jgi:uncharacterized protein YecE (DUF72 family)